MVANNSPRSAGISRCSPPITTSLDNWRTGLTAANTNPAAGPEMSPWESEMPSAAVAYPRPALRMAALVVSGLLWVLGPRDATGADLLRPTPPPLAAEIPSSWTFEFTPYAWATSLKGSQTVRGRTVDVDETFLDIVRHTSRRVWGSEARLGAIKSRSGAVSHAARAGECDSSRSDETQGG